LVFLYLLSVLKKLKLQTLNKLSFTVLKKTRVALSLLVLIFCTLAFFNFHHTISSIISKFTIDLQFVPSIIKTISITGFIGIGLIVTLVLTLLFGRIYCSVICPLGIFQDIVSWISRKLKIKTRYQFKKSLPFLRYSILILSISSAISGLITLLVFLDPFSIYGRFTTYLFKPILTLINNFGANALAKTGVYNLLSRSELLSVSVWVLLINLILLFIISLMSFTLGRIYCNTICPVGTLLGLISKVSFFKINLDKSACTKCGKCVSVCKSECIDLKTLKIDHSRCVACYNCLAICPEDAAKYQFKNNYYTLKQVDNRQNITLKIDTSKRDFIINFLAGTVSFTLFLNPFKSFGQLTEKEVDNDNKKAISPPGSISINHLNNLCTGCSVCISACPTGVLRPSFLEYGLSGMLQPYLDFGKNFCEFDCIICGQLCPTGAIKPLTLEAKHLCQIGVAKFEIKKCIVETDKVKCTKCYDHCPVNAIKMIPHENFAIPEIIENACIGCGECDYVCPARPVRAIVVEGNPIHSLAIKQKEDSKKTESEDFPF